MTVQQITVVTDIPQRYVRTPGAARYMDIPVSSLETMRSRGGGPPYMKVQGKVFYAIADLDAWLAEHAVCT